MNDELYKEIDQLNREIERLKLEAASCQDERKEAFRKLDETGSTLDVMKRKLQATETGHKVEVTILSGQKEKLQQAVERLSEKAISVMGGIMGCVSAFLKYANHLQGCPGNDGCVCSFVKAKQDLLSILDALRKQP